MGRIGSPSDLPGDTPLLSDESAQTWMNLDALSDRAQFWANQLTSQRSLVFHCISNSVDGVAQFLGALRAGHSVALLDPNLPEASQAELVNCYKPGYIISAEGTISRNKNGVTDLHPDLFVLLSTSGSTGSSKLVRLSATNLTSNAKAIAEVLDIQTPEVGCGHSPLHYSYGLSVLTSHLVCGAPVFLTSRGFIDAEFWKLVRKWEIAHLPRVPFHFQMLARLRFERINLPSLRVLTQAGGSLDAKLGKMAHEYMNSIGGHFHVMYGQTEASPRITTISHEDFANCPNSVGTALTGGTLRILDTNDAPVPINIEGEVVYSGPNVMMGYAETSADLALDDTQEGVIKTGDLGRLDAEGRLTITGRTKRIGKIAGLRVNIDEVERLLVEEFDEVAVIQQGENLVLHHLPVEDKVSFENSVRKALISRFTLPSVAYKFEVIDEFPRSERGKIDYVTLAKSATESGK